MDSRLRERTVAFLSREKHQTGHVGMLQEHLPRGNLEALVAAGFKLDFSI